MRRRDIHAAALAGQGSHTLVFAHGFGTDQQAWRHVQPLFVGRNQTLLFDHVGCGRADGRAYDDRRHASLQGYASDLVDLLDDLALRGTTLVTHSASGMIGMLAAVQRPDLFRRLVMLAPSPCFYNDGDYIGGFDRSELEELVESIELNYYDWAEKAAPTLMNRPDRPELATELARSLKRTDSTLAKKFARVVFTSDSRAQLPLLQTPTTVGQCRDDLLAPPTVGAYMKRTLPHCDLVHLKTTGHCPHLSAPDETVAVIENTL